MRVLAMLTVTLVVFLLAVPSFVLASETLEVTADSTLAGNAGFIVTSTEPGFPTETFFGFEEAGKIRIFASRGAGSSVWDIFPSAQYLCQSTAMTIGDTWRFLDTDLGDETVATVAAQENVTTAAGTFSTFRVDIALASAPGTVVEAIWFSSGFGIIREEEYAAGVLVWKSELFSFTIVGGTGFFPAAVGNRWDSAEINVVVEDTSWGAVKSRYN